MTAGQALQGHCFAGRLAAGWMMTLRSLAFQPADLRMTLAAFSCAGARPELQRFAPDRDVQHPETVEEVLHLVLVMTVPNGIAQEKALPSVPKPILRGTPAAQTRSALERERFRTKAASYCPSRITAR